MFRWWGTCFLCLFSVTVYADNQPRFNSGFDEKPWEEQQEDLPSFPDLQDANWFSFQIDNQSQITPFLLLTSPYMAKDRTVRYVLNLRSPSGFNNISAEGVHCDTGRYKAFAFGDTVNHRWIKTRNTSWQETGSALNRYDLIRYAIKNVFCGSHFPQNHDEIKKRFKEQY